MATIGLKKFTLRVSRSFVSNAAKEIIHDADEEEKKEKHSHAHHHSKETSFLTVPKTLTNSKSSPALKNVLSESSLKDLETFSKNSTTTLSLSSLNNFEKNKHEKPVFHFDNEFEISSTDEHGTHIFR